MVSIVTGSTAAAAGIPVLSLGLALVLILTLVLREYLRSALPDRTHTIGQVFNVALAPLLIAFVIIVVLQLSGSLH